VKDMRITKQVRQQSILYRTGQKLKFWIPPVFVLLGSITILGTQLFQDNLTHTGYVRILAIAIVVDAVGLIFPLFAISCPRCGAKWLWLAYSRSPGKWYQWLLSQSACPNCGYAGNAKCSGAGSTSP
jgi:predicted RNA-binding Zn-ribbon protein involved in translation (DUF1610 family)